MVCKLHPWKHYQPCSERKGKQRPGGRGGGLRRYLGSPLHESLLHFVLATLLRVGVREGRQVLITQMSKLRPWEVVTHPRSDSQSLTELGLEGRATSCWWNVPSVCPLDRARPRAPERPEPEGSERGAHGGQLAQPPAVTGILPQHPRQLLLQLWFKSSLP